MNPVVTDLLGEIVEFHAFTTERYDRLVARGHVRAVYEADATVVFLVEHDLGSDSAAAQANSLDGGLALYALRDVRVRCVERCTRCTRWDQKSQLIRVYSTEGLLSSPRSIASRVRVLFDRDPRATLTIPQILRQLELTRSESDAVRSVLKRLKAAKVVFQARRGGYQRLDSAAAATGASTWEHRGSCWSGGTPSG